MQKEDEFQKQLCDEHGVVYEAPVAEKRTSQRRKRCAKNKKIIQGSKKETMQMTLTLGIITTLYRLAHASIIQTFTIFFQSDSYLLCYQ